MELSLDAYEGLSIIITSFVFWSLFSYTEPEDKGSRREYKKPNLNNKKTCPKRQYRRLDCALETSSTNRLCPSKNTPCSKQDSIVNIIFKIYDLY